MKKKIIFFKDSAKTALSFDIELKDKQSKSNLERLLLVMSGTNKFPVEFGDCYGTETTIRVKDKEEEYE